MKIVKRIFIDEWSIERRVLYFCATIIVPLILFALAWGDPLKPEWQSGLLIDRVAVMLGPEIPIYFYPFALFSMGTVAALLLDWERWKDKFWVRLGIYTGLILAVQYAVLIILAVGLDLITLIIWVPGSILLFEGMWGAYYLCKQYFGMQKTLIGFAVLFGLLSVVGGIFFFLLAIPFWPLWVGVLFCLRLGADRAVEWKPSYEHLLGWGWWSVAYGVSWRFAIHKAIELYAALPAEPPVDCYVATAASRGDEAVVGSWEVVENGRSWRVNQQLQDLKAFELGLRVVTPDGHRWLRRFYDFLGPRLAARLNHPRLANGAYQFLRPFSWLGTIWLSFVAPGWEKYRDQLY